jgi:hypothetical protein
MAAYPRRFRVWPRENLIGSARTSAYAEGVQFTDGTVVVRFLNGLPTSVVYPDHGVDAICRGLGFGGPGEIEWLDGRHG